MENSQLITIVTEDDEVYQFEGIVSYTGNDTSSLTSYPTSEGTPRTDNIYNNPNKFTCSISIGGNVDVIDEWGSGTDRPKSAMNILTKWKEDAIALTIITNQKDYYNMFLTGISPQSTNQNSYDLAAGLSFDELRIVNFTTTTIEVSSQYATAQDGTSDTSNQNDIQSEVGDVFSKAAVAAGQTAGGLLAGAGVGAAIGTWVLPGVGTGLGAAIGAVTTGIGFIIKDIFG